MVPTDATENERVGRAPSRLRIAQIGSTAYRGGVTEAVLTLCMGLRKHGHEVMLITDGGDLRGLQEAGVRCFVTDLELGPVHILRGIVDVRRTLRAFRPDVVHVHGRAGSLRCHLAGRRPDWFTLHNTHLTHRKGLIDIGILRRVLSPMARRFFVLDEEAQTYLKRALGVAPGRVELVANGIDTDRFRPPTSEERAAARTDFGVKPGNTLALFVGRLDASKQPLAVVQLAGAAKRAKLDSIQFVLVGEGELASAIRAEIAKEQVEDRCALYGWMDPLRAYFAADLVMMPSLFEGFGLVGAEAIATGCPVLRSDTGGASRQIVEGKTGFLCTTDAGDFISRAMSVLRQPITLQNMRVEARRWAEAQLGADTQARLTIEHYLRYASSTL